MASTFVHEEAYRGKDTVKKIADFGKVTVCGCGAVGSNLIDNMVRQGFKSIATVDFDRVEDHNRHTQVWGRKEIGHTKVSVIKNRIFNDHGVIIEDVPEKLEENNIKKIFKVPSALIVDGFDNSASRALVTKFCLNNNIPCLHIGMNGDYAEIIWNEIYRVPNGGGKDICDYPLARNLILLVVATATEAIIRYIDRGVHESYTITLGDFCIKKYGE